MDKVIELAKQAGFNVSPVLGLRDKNHKEVFAANTCISSEIEQFYDLARADLEAENAKLKELLKQTTEELQYGNPRDIATDTYRYDNDLIHAARAALGEK